MTKRMAILGVMVWLSGCATLKEAADQEFQVWNSAGFTYSEYSEWKVAGFNPLSRHPFDNRCHYCPTPGGGGCSVFTPCLTASAWKLAGLNPQEARTWIDAGVSIPENAASLKDAGFSPQESAKWTTLRFTPQAAALWKSVAFDPQGADEWEKAGFTFKTAKLWRDAGFGVKDAVNLRATIPVEAAKAYKDAGLSIETTIVWAATLPAGEAQEFKKLGLAKDEERELSVIGRQIHDWQKAGFSVKDAIMWSRAQFGLSEAVKWRDAGYAPKSAADWIRGGIAKPSDAKAIGKKCPKGMEPLEVLYQLNPYDVKGRCFQFVGTTQQILSRSSGLYLLGGEAPALVNFGEHSAPPHVFRGITKGVGAYKYVAVSGSEKIVPSLEAVLVHESQ